MNDELVSIIMPVYNCEKYVEKAIKSVQLQIYTNWELIIINDGSTDDSMTKIEEQIKSIKDKVKLINLEENQGVANARNIAIDKACGKYIAYLDADDLWEKEKMHKQIKFMKTNKIAFSYTSYSRIKEDGNLLKTVEVPEKTNYTDLLKSTMMLTSTIIIDTENIPKEKMKMPNLKITEDTQTWLNILKSGVVAYGLNENLTQYRQRKDSTSSNKIESIIGMWKVYRKYQEINISKSLYYMIFHIMNAIKKRI